MYVHVCTCTYMYVYVCVFVSNMHDTRMHACMCVHMCVAYMFVTISAVDSGAVGDRTGRQRERERERIASKTSEDLPYVREDRPGHLG